MATSDALTIETSSRVIPGDHFESLPSAACKFKSESNSDILCLDGTSHVESREVNDVDSVDLFLNPTNTYSSTSASTSSTTHGEPLRTVSFTESIPYTETHPFSEFSLPSATVVDQGHDVVMEALESKRDFSFNNNGDLDLAQLLQGHTPGDIGEDFDSILNDFNIAELIRESDGAEISSCLADSTMGTSGFGPHDPQVDVSRELDAAKARLAELEAVFKLQQTHESNGNGHYLPRHHPYAQVHPQAQLDGRVNLGLLLELASVHQQQRLQQQQQLGNNQSVLTLLESLLARQDLASSLGIDSNNATVKLLALLLHAQLAQQQRRMSVASTSELQNQNNPSENIFSNLARRQSFDASSLRRASLSAPEFSLPQHNLSPHQQPGLFTTMPGYQGIAHVRRYSCPEARDLTMFTDGTSGYPWQRGQVVSDEECCVSSGLGGDENKSNLKLFVQTIGRYTKKEREARIERYRLKRQQRCFSKKIRYQCRKQLADSRPRFKGRFCKIPESDSPEMSSSPNQHHPQEDDDNKVNGHSFAAHSLANHINNNTTTTKTKSKGRMNRRESVSQPTTAISPSTDNTLSLSCDAILSPLASVSSSLTSSPSLNEMHDAVPNLATPKKLKASPATSRARASPPRTSAQPQPQRL